ncbi:MAG: Ig-like domain-containing protein [Gammaproteobacteria bacterium]
MAGAAVAIPTDTDVTGSLSKAENTCVSPIALFTSTPPQSCNYSGGEDVALLVGSGAFRVWMGPLDSGGFYATGTGPNPLTTAGSEPNDGKVNLPITGTLTIEDNNTPGNGADDSLRGTLIIGAGERSVSTSDGSAIESFSSITHTIPNRVFDSAVANGSGGFDYVIGTAGFPALHRSAFGDDYPSESASIATGASQPPDFHAWDQANGGSVPVVNFPFPNPPPPQSQGPYTVEIVTYAPATGNVGPNIGVATTAIIADYACVAGDGASGPINDCDPDPNIGAPTVWGQTGAEFDNLIVQLSTDANNNIVSAEAFYVIEYKIPSLNANQGNPGSFIGGTLTLSPVPPDPTAVDDTATTEENLAVNIDILGNDTLFIDNVTVTVTDTSGSQSNMSDQGGTVVLNGTNPGPQAGIDVTYTPPMGFSGDDSFVYEVEDDLARTDSASVVVTVVAPEAVDDTETAPPDTAIMIDILGNDTLFADPVTVTLMNTSGSESSTMTITSDQGGTVVVNGQNSGPQAGIDITYTPLMGFGGEDTFRYQVDDNLLRSDTADVRVLVGANAIDDQETTARDTPIDIDILGNDVQFVDPVTVTLKTDAADPGDQTTRATAQGGTVVLNGTNPGPQGGIDVTYTPPTGFTGDDTFVYEILDAQAQSDTADVRITVAAPTAGDDSDTTQEDTPVDVDILGNDTLFADPVTVTLMDTSGGQSSMSSINSDQGGTVVLNGTNPGPQGGIDVTYTPPSGYSGADTFRYQIDDSVNADDAGVTIVVTAAAPPIVPVAPDTGVSTGESQAVDIVVNTLPGVSLGITPVTISVVSGPANGTATVFGQTITYTPTGFPSNDAFDYMIADAQGSTDTGTINVAIGPALIPDAIDDNVSMQQDTSLDIVVTTNDVAGSGDIADHTVAIASDPVSGTAVLGADNTITYTPDAGTSGIQTFTYTLTDVDMDLSAPAVVTVDVEQVPVAAKLPQDDSSALGPWSIGLLLLLIGWRRRRYQ